MTKQIPWPRIFAEGLVIIASILLALAADAWWDERQERVEERDILRQLSTELTAVDSVMREWRNNHQLVFEAGEVLLAHTGPDAEPSLTPDSIGRLLGVVQFTWTLDPPDGVLTSLVASGDLSLITNTELRAALAEWQGLLADLNGDEELTLRLVQDQLGPYMDSRASYRTVVALQDDYPGTRSRFEDGFRAVLSDREFENLLQARVYNTFWILRAYDEALAGLTRSRSLIRGELEG